MIREDIASGRADVWPAILSASAAETLAASGMTQLSDAHGTTPELAQLAASIPSSELRQRSRRIGLVRMWRQYQRTPWKREVAGVEQYGKGFMGQRVAAGVDRIPLERTRADRFIDLATRRSLEQLSMGFPNIDSEATSETDRLWAETLRPRYEVNEPIRQFLPWPNESDPLIKDVQARFPNAATQP